MAFLHHPPPRRSARQVAAPTGNELSEASKPRETSPSSVAVDAYNDVRTRNDDWSIVFPGRARQQVAVDPTSPFVDASAQASGSDDGLQLTLPPLHDGTGRFTRPSSPSYDADEDDGRVDGDDNELIATPSPISPTSTRNALADPPPSDILTLGSYSDEEELDFDDDDDQSALFSEDENSNGRSEGARISTAQLRRSSRLSHRGSRTLASSSWSWMNAAQSQHARGTMPQRAAADLAAEATAVLTDESDSEVESPAVTTSEHERTLAAMERSDAAFEEAMGSAYFAHSAGLYARVPKRRHRKNGESEKGSKRSNNSAAVASELLAAQRRRAAAVIGGAGVARRSQTSAASARSRSRLGKGPAATTSRKPLDAVDGSVSAVATTDNRPRSERLLTAILRRVFGVEDEEVLQAFLRDEGPLQVDEEEQLTATSAAVASRAPLGSQGGEDDVWGRNQRTRHMRLLLDGGSVREEAEEVDGDDEDDENEVALSKTTGHPQRSYVAGNVAEPTLSEALHATVMSGLRVVPSGLSLLLAGSNSVRFMNYLVGRIGPSLTERVRKLVEEGAPSNGDDLETVVSRGARSNSVVSSTARLSDIASSADGSSWSWEDVDVSSLRFKGSKHPALASSSSRSGGTRSNASTIGAHTAALPASSL